MPPKPPFAFNQLCSALPSDDGTSFQVLTHPIMQGKDPFWKQVKRSTIQFYQGFIDLGTERTTLVGHSTVHIR
jgi:hypothetical protein